MGKLPVVCILTLTDKLTHRIHRAQTLRWLSLLLILHLSLGLCLHLVPLIGQSEGCVGSLDGAGVYLTGSVDAGRCLLPHAHRAGIGKSYCSSAQQRCERHTQLVRRAGGSQRGPAKQGQTKSALLPTTKTAPSGSVQGTDLKNLSRNRETSLDPTSQSNMLFSLWAAQRKSHS